MNVKGDDLAECGVCGRTRPVCCDDGYAENPDNGEVLHFGATCRECCPNHHRSAYACWNCHESVTRGVPHACDTEAVFGG